MSINDLLDMDLMPIIMFIGIVSAIILIIFLPSYLKGKDNFASLPATAEYELKVVQKDMGKRMRVGGSLAFPTMGYQCSFLFEKKDGSRLIIKTSKPEFYEKILVGDIVDVKYKNNSIANIMVDFTLIK